MMKNTLSVRLVLFLISLGMACRALKAGQDDDLKETCKTIHGCTDLIHKATKDQELLTAKKAHELWLSLK